MSIQSVCAEDYYHSKFFLAQSVFCDSHLLNAAAILSYAVSHLHEDTGKLRKTCADAVGHFTESDPSL